MPEPTLQFLGEQIARIQAEFALMRQTTATNLEILLAAIAGRA